MVNYEEIMELIGNEFEEFEGDRVNSRWLKDSNNFLYRRYGKINQRGKEQKIVCLEHPDCPANGVLFLDPSCRSNSTRGTLNGTHNHEADIKKVMTCRFKAGFRDSAKSVDLGLKKTYDKEVAKYDLQYAAAFPSMYSLSNTYYRIRAGSFPPEKNPLTALEAAARSLSQEYYVREAKFYRGCVTVNGQTSLIFMSPGMLQVRFESAISIHADSTFKSCPKPFLQLLTVHFEFKNEILPCVYCLMSDRSADSYRAVFSKIMEVLPNSKPLKMVSDFEEALHVAVKDLFPSSFDNVGCWFHYTSNIWKHVGKEGLKRAGLCRRGHIKEIISMVIALPLLPDYLINEGHLFIKEFLNVSATPVLCKEELERLLSYVQDYWLMKIGPKRLSVFGLPRRTNNDVESFNAVVGSTFGRHPTFLKFMSTLLSFEATYNLKLRRIESNEDIRPPRKNKSANSKDHHIKLLENKLLENRITVGQFLKLARNLTRNNSFTATDADINVGASTSRGMCENADTSHSLVGPNASANIGSVDLFAASLSSPTQYAIDSTINVEVPSNFESVDPMLNAIQLDESYMNIGVDDLPDLSQPTSLSSEIFARPEIASNDPANVGSVDLFATCPPPTQPNESLEIEIIDVDEISDLSQPSSSSNACTFSVPPFEVNKSHPTYLKKKVLDSKRIQKQRYRKKVAKMKIQHAVKCLVCCDVGKKQ